MDESDDDDEDISPINIDAMTDAEVISFLNENNISENWSVPRNFNIAKEIIATPIPLDGLKQTFNDLFVTQTITTFGPNNSTRTVFRDVPDVSREAAQKARATGVMPPGFKIDTSYQGMDIDDRSDLTPSQIQQGRQRGTFPSGYIQPGGGKYTKHKKYRKGKKTLKKKD